jgi:hypothetical protein
MADPITVAIATAAAGKIAESLTGAASDSAIAIAQRIREKFRRQPAALAALEAAHDDPVRLQDLVNRLEEAMAQDPDFSRQIRQLWRAAGPQVADQGSGNAFHGRAEKVAQVTVVRGDLNIY